MYDTLVNLLQRLIYVPNTSGMVHPGLSPGWVLLSLVCMLLLVLRSSLLSTQGAGMTGGMSIAQLPWVGPRLHHWFNRPYVLVTVRVLVAAVFLLVIYAGLFGTPAPQRNLATMRGAPRRRPCGGLESAPLPDCLGSTVLSSRGRARPRTD